MPSRITLEICVETVEGAARAQAGGADRLELCSALSEGGLTPSIGLIRAAVAATTLPVMVMIRPRGGGYCYTEHEQRVMLADVAAAAKAGAAGVVFGALDANRDVDLPFVREFVAAARSTGENETPEITFHRAIDVARCPFTVLEALVQLGVNRLLTSGQQPTVVAGVEVISQLMDRAAGRVIVMPGAGLRPDNVGAVVSATGVTEVHGSASDWISDLAESPGGSALVPAYTSRRRITSEVVVRRMREALDRS